MSWLSLRKRLPDAFLLCANCSVAVPVDFQIDSGSTWTCRGCGKKTIVELHTESSFGAAFRFSAVLRATLIERDALRAALGNTQAYICRHHCMGHDELSTSHVPECLDARKALGATGGS